MLAELAKSIELPIISKIISLGCDTIQLYGCPFHQVIFIFTCRVEIRQSYDLLRNNGLRVLDGRAFAIFDKFVQFFFAYYLSSLLQLTSSVFGRLILSGPAFSVVHQARGGGLRGPDAKNQGYHQPIEMKLCLS